MLVSQSRLHGWDFFSGYGKFSLNVMVITQTPWPAVFEHQPCYSGRHLTSQNHFCDGYAID